MRLLRSHGITRNIDQMENKNDLPWYYEQVDLGYNYRMTDIQAALGISQLEGIDQNISKREKIANYYDFSFNKISVQPITCHKDRSSSYHIYVVRVDDSGKRKDLFNKLRDNGVMVNVHYIPVYKQPYYENMGFDVNNFPNSEEYYKTCITLPIYPNLENNDLNMIIDTIKCELSQ
jgi:dTDP-4-amino-4,6-dideoxygalactose transaminase